MSFELRELLRHILAETEFLLNVGRGLSAESLERDETLRRAVVRSIEVIGEAAKKLPAEFKASHPGVEWRAMTGMRDRLIHAYFSVDYSIVCDVVVNKIPALHGQVAALLQSDSSG